MSMIERVARIVEAALERHGVTDFEGTADDARAAIEAMREPTPRMLGPTMEREFDYVGITQSGASQLWTAMIDAALEEGK